MSFNADGLPITGSVLAAGVCYAALSLFVTGPLIAERMVAKMNWPVQCERLISDEVMATAPPRRVMPKLGCNELFGSFFGQEGAAFCDYYGDSFESNPISQSAEAMAQAEIDAQEMRRDLAVSRAGSRCECAVTTTLEDRRVPFAIFGGSARLITPASIRALSSDLQVNLNSAACAMKG